VLGQHVCTERGGEGNKTEEKKGNEKKRMKIQGDPPCPELVVSISGGVRLALGGTAGYIPLMGRVLIAVRMVETGLSTDIHTTLRSVDGGLIRGHRLLYLTMHHLIYGFIAMISF
jgi:hypothetical protein